MTKPRSNRLGMYADVREVLDAALAAGGGHYTCATHGDAVHWRQRAYRFRKLYAETLGLSRESHYDTIVLPRIPADSCIVNISIRAQVGTFIPSETPAAAPVIEDELFDIAVQVAAKLGDEK